MSTIDKTSVQYIKGVGPARARLFGNLGIVTVEDLMYFFPRRYEDRTRMTPIPELKVGEFHTVSGQVLVRGGRQSWYTRKHVYETAIDDGKGRLHCVWFNQPYLDRYFKVGQKVVLYGKVEVYKNRIQMISPEYELIGPADEGLSINRIVPVYPLTRGMSQRYIRKILRLCLDRYREEVHDILPVALRNKLRLMNIRRSLENIHFPETLETQQDAHRRISFEEFFVFQISVIKRRMSMVLKEGTAHQIPAELITTFNRSFGFELTKAQRRVIGEISTDMQKETPMLRLLQGDVGSGKTLVALFGCVAAWKNGRQAAVMAPTEILARQHFESITRMLSGGPFGKIRAALLLGALKKGEKEKILAGLKDGSVDLVIGTHALLKEAVEIPKLSYVVIDEQHKFGVKQRALLSAGGTNPDVLVMTATPIPRTLSLTLFGDLDVSTIDDLPPGRSPVKTKLFSHEQAVDAYAAVRQQVERGGQAYIIYPIIEESEKLDLKAAQTMFRQLSKTVFKGLKVGLIHGQMDRFESENIMQEFKANRLQILFATTVLEVGVDVPNASVMVIEHADRFGLAQLHQLRGRIGRGGKRGMCFLIADPVTEEGQARLKAVLSTTDGFEIARQDLLIRGPGHYFGRHQHGLNELRFANPVTQIDILELARREAQELVNADPELTSEQNKVLKTIIQQRYPGYLKMVEAG